MKRLSSAILSLAALLVVAAPASAWSISGNGSDSRSEIRVNLRNRVSRYQVNEVVNENVIEVESNTGNNDTNDNTGGDVTVDTGNTNTTVAVVNAGGTNVDEGDDCDCVDDTDVEIEIKNNGSDSENNVRYERSSLRERMQENFFASFNGVRVRSNTGENDTNDNTGGEDGDVDVTTGRDSVDIYIENVGASNENN